jgi:hypothetical protein
MTYEDMSLTQLKSLCRDKGLGTGRSKQELINKLVAYETRVNTPEDVDVTETQAGTEKGKSVEVESAPEIKPESEFAPKDEDPSPTVFRISITHSGPLLDSQHEAYRKRTYGLAQAEGLVPFGGEMAPRLVKCENGQLTYEVEVHG